MPSSYYDTDTPLFIADAQLQAPTERLPAMPMPPALAYQIVHDEAMLDGNPRLNMATFLTSWMDDYARRLVDENLAKNLVDRSEYPQTSRIEQRCINILADLWHSPQTHRCTGTSTAGSSEACLLGALAALLRWRKAQEGRPAGGRPNFVVSAAHHVVWHKLAAFWDVEMRTVPLTAAHPSLDAEGAAARCDERTFLVVGIASATATGLTDDLPRLNTLVERLNTTHGYSIAIHVDAATGGFLLPFLSPGYKWDFRLECVHSISTSAHKFGLVYPGLGWIVWRGREYLPEAMRFEAIYLGEEEVLTPTLNFSRPANLVLAQYYQFLRLGFRGYRNLQQTIVGVADRLRVQLKSMGMECLPDPLPSPVVVWTMPRDVHRKWTLYDLSDAMRASGWLIPAYALPPGLEDRVAMRIVVRQGMGPDLTRILLNDMERAMHTLNRRSEPTETYRAVERGEAVRPRNFAHDR